MTGRGRVRAVRCPRVIMPVVVIAQSRLAPVPSRSMDVGSIMLWVGVLVVVVVGGGLALFWIRRRLLGEDRQSAGDGVSLQTLRDMKARGELSDAEFEAAKAVVLQELGAQGKRGGPNDPAAALRPKSPPPELRAKSGFDLTGEPLPKPSDPSHG
jgi:hypothetical protein